MRDHKQVWWGPLPERCIYDVAFQAMQKIAYRMGRLSVQTNLGWIPIYKNYGRTDTSRQGMGEIFMQQSERPDDTLVMLDIDHDHPTNVIQRMVAHNKPVVVPLMFRRQPPFDACAFRIGPDGAWHHVMSMPPGLHRMDAVGSGVIAIQRQVFEQLRAAGHDWWFKYEYMKDAQGNLIGPSEDLYFSKICGAAGIEMWVDFDTESPHFDLGTIDRSVKEQYLADHPELIENGIKLSSNGKDHYDNAAISHHDPT